MRRPHFWFCLLLLNCRTPAPPLPPTTVIASEKIPPAEETPLETPGERELDAQTWCSAAAVVTQPVTDTLLALSELHASVRYFGFVATNNAVDGALVDALGNAELDVTVRGYACALDLCVANNAPSDVSAAGWTVVRRMKKLANEGDTTDVRLFEVRDPMQERVLGYVVGALVHGEPDYSAAFAVGFDAAAWWKTTEALPLRTGDISRVTSSPPLLRHTIRRRWSSSHRLA